MLHAIFELIALAMEVLAVVIAVLGAGKFIYRLLREDLRMKDAASCAFDMSTRRLEFGGYILASLEVLIIADIIKTITSQSQEDLIYLAVLTAVRVVIGYFLNIEMKHVKGGKTD